MTNIYKLQSHGLASRQALSTVMATAEDADLEKLRRRATEGGEQLDRAALHFRRISDAPQLADEEDFADAERDYLAAKTTYLDALAALTGQHGTDIERRVLV